MWAGCTIRLSVYWTSGWAGGEWFRTFIPTFKRRESFESKLCRRKQRTEILRVFLQSHPPLTVSSSLLAHYWHSFQQLLINPSCHKLGVAAFFPHCIHAHVPATMLLQNAWPWATGSWCNPSIHVNVVGSEGSQQTAFGCHLAPLTSGHPAVLHLWSQNLLLRLLFIPSVFVFGVKLKARQIHICVVDQMWQVSSSPEKKVNCSSNSQTSTLVPLCGRAQFSVKVWRPH